tara:strand:- start:1150 stop:5349 length:4200 start_codon:yes stop_codon:yes gene_type:complete
MFLRNDYFATKFDWVVAKKNPIFSTIGSYFSRNYSVGKRVPLPDAPKDMGWIEWKDKRLREIGFYDPKSPKSIRLHSVDEKPPRLVLREKEHVISKNEVLSEGHMEFKIWLQHKIEEASIGRASPRFLYSEGREDEREAAMKTWDRVSKEFEVILDRVIFRNKKIRESRHLHIMEKFSTWNEKFGGGIIAAVEEEKDAFIRELIESDGQSIEWDPIAHGEKMSELGNLGPSSEQYGIKSSICRALVRELVSGSKTGGLDNADFVISIPSMTLMTHLSSEIEKILRQGIEVVEEFSDERGNFNFISENLNEDEKDALKSLRNEGFGNVQGSGSKTSEERLTLNCRKLAYNIVVSIHDEGFLSIETMDQEMYRIHYQEGDENKDKARGVKKYPGALIFSERLKGLIGQSSRRDFIEGKEHAIFRWMRGSRNRWMYSPPWDHKRTRLGGEDYELKGGLLMEINREVVTNHRHFEQFRDESGEVMSRCEPDDSIRNALNALQRVQWEINLGFLTRLFEVKLADGMILPPNEVEDWIGEKGSVISEILPRREFSDAFYDSVSKDGSFDSTDDPEQDQIEPGNSRVTDDRRLLLEWTKRIIDHNANVFWHSWACDFRGRVMPRCTALSPQGDDLSRALICFKEWKPLGKTKDDTVGIRWFHVYVHNLMENIESRIWNKEGHPPSCQCCIPAAKNASFAERVKWVEGNLSQLREIGREPEAFVKELGLDKYRPGKNESYQRTAALIELDRIHKEFEANDEDWTRVSSGMPIRLDATCNGFQHVSALIGDENLAKLVNVIGIEERGPNDLYSEVARVAKEKFGGREGDLRNTLGVGEGGFGLTKKEVDEAIDLIFSRTVAKRPTMTRAYGAKETMKHFDGRGGDGRPNFVQVRKNEAEKEASNENKKEIDDEFQALFIDWEKTDQNQWFEDKLIESREERKRRLRKRRDCWRALAEYRTEEGDGKPKKLSKTKLDKWIKDLRETKAVRTWADGSSLHDCLILPSKNISKMLAIPEGTYYNGFWYNLWGRFDSKNNEYVNYWNVLDSSGNTLGDGYRKGRDGRAECEKKAREFIGKDRKGGMEVDEIFRRARIQHRVTLLVNRAIKESIKEVTSGNYDTLEENLGLVSRKETREWPGVTWGLPRGEGGVDSFIVNHYYISPFAESDSRWMNPCHRSAIYSRILPKWYTFTKREYKKEKLAKERKWARDSREKSKHRIFLRFVKHFQNDDGAWDKRLSDSDKEWLTNSSNGNSKSSSLTNRFRILLEEYSESDEAVKEMLVLFRHWSSSLIRYDDRKEGNRINSKRAKSKFSGALPPNFVHSIDAYHMRRVINRLDQEIGNLGFWSVHDAFGTHACDVEKLREVVMSEFHGVHSELMSVFEEKEGWEWVGKKEVEESFLDPMKMCYLIG